MATEYQRDGDIAFIGLNSRDNPMSLPKGYVSQSQNFRLDRGIASVRKGIRRKTSSTIIGQTIYGTGSFMNSTGQEIFVLVMTDGLYTYNPQTEILSTKVAFPVGETITSADITAPSSNGFCSVVTAIDKIYISRGHSKRPLIATINTTSFVISSVIAAPTSGTGADFPNCSSLLYFGNRLIAIGQDHNLGYTPTARSRDSICVSNYLDFDYWDALDVFNFNEGTNDEVIAVAPWTLNEFVVFLRNSIYYVNVGSGRYTFSDPLNSTAYMKNLATGIGCVARNSIVTAAGGVLFLSDNGIYFLEPQPTATNESVRLLANSRPISDPIDDVIQRINKNYSYASVGTYWNNRYYLAVPIDGSATNNAVLVFNFILKSWESVDTYPAGFNVFNFMIGKKDNQRKLYGFDSTSGIYIMEELEYDEYGIPTGTPILPFYLPSLLSPVAFTPNQIQGIIKTRRYSFDNLREKRFSTVEAEINCNAGSAIKTYADLLNQDGFTQVDSFGSPSDEDFTRRNPIRKIGTGLQIKFITNNLRTAIRSLFVVGTNLGKTNKNAK